MLQTHLQIFSTWWMRPCIPPRIQTRLLSVRDLDPPTLSARSGPTFLVPPTTKTVQRMAIRYMPVTEAVTPPISPDTPSPTQKPGRSRGHGKWRAPQLANPGVGIRSRTKQIELDQAEATQAQASRAAWLPRPDNTDQLQRMMRELQIAQRYARRTQRYA